MDKKRAIVLVLDGCGAGAAPDAKKFGDHNNPSTVLHVWESVGGFESPNLAKLGFLKACGVDSTPKMGAYGRLEEQSQGKDSVTGHWELMGAITETPFPTYPEGFPKELVLEFERRIGAQVIGNKPASGTQIIKELGLEHMVTGKPILYTSADSVFQVACHEEIVPLERLYEICRIGREVCKFPHNIQRVIARPFVGTPQTGFIRTGNRKDFPLQPPLNLVDQIGDVFGIGVIPELFDGRGFLPIRRTQNNIEHAEMVFEALHSEAPFIFANFEDFDMLYGHRNDPLGFARCLEEFDRILGSILKRLGKNDLLILCSDHGNDPTTPGTDHSREYVPLCIYNPKIPVIDLGDIKGMDAVAGTVASYLGIHWPDRHHLLERLGIKL